ncbi:polyprotein, partial [Frankliniella fusca]
FRQNAVFEELPSSPQPRGECASARCTIYEVTLFVYLEKYLGPPSASSGEAAARASVPPAPPRPRRRADPTHGSDRDPAALRNGAAMADGA